MYFLISCRALYFICSFFFNNALALFLKKKMKKRCGGSGKEVKNVLTKGVYCFEWQLRKRIRAMAEVKNISDRVKAIIEQSLQVPKEKITDNASFAEDLGADSLDTVELVMAFEEEFGCEIPDEAAEKIKTVKDAIDFLGKAKVA